MKFVHFEYLWFLLFLIPLILLQLSKKSKANIIVPHLQFWLTEREIQKTKKKIRFHKIWRYIPLFLLFIVLNFSVATPYTGKIQDSSIKNIIVLDTSISMMTEELGKNRLQTAIEKIKKDFSSLPNTIVIATSNPPTIQNITKISNIEYSQGNIRQSIDLLKNIYKKNDNIIIFTDGVHPDWTSQISMLETLCQEKLFIHIIGKYEQNIGLYASYDAFHQKISIHIYHDYSLPKKITLQWRKIHDPKKQPEVIFEDQKEIFLTQSITQEDIILTNVDSGGWWEIYINEVENFKEDNRIFCYVPPKKKCKVLLLSDHNETKLLAALGSYQNLIDSEQSNFVTEKDTLENKVYDLVIVTKENWDITENFMFTKILFWKTKGNFLSKKPNKISNSYISKINPHILSKNIDFTTLQIKKGEVYADVRQAIVSNQNGALIWQETFLDKEYAYVGFSIEDSNISFLPSFPLFIKNSIEWATPQETNEENIKQVTSIPISLASNIEHPKTFIPPDVPIYLNWYFMLLAYILCVISFVYLILR